MRLKSFRTCVAINNDSGAFYHPDGDVSFIYDAQWMNPFKSNKNYIGEKVQADTLASLSGNYTSKTVGVDFFKAVDVASRAVEDIKSACRIENPSFMNS